ncbi:MAG: hypothetical protein ACO1N9_12270 [Flavobacterium sp.]
MSSFTALLEIKNARNRKKHSQKVQLLEEIIITLTVNELSLVTKLKLSAEIDEIMKNGRIKLMHDIDDLQHELFKIIFLKNKADGVQ